MSVNIIKVNNSDTNYTHSIFDISEYNQGATYEDLSAALAAVSQEKQKGGMTIRYVQTSDNKYVQYRLMPTSFSTIESDWQGVDTELVYRSHNLVENGVVYEADALLAKQLSYPIADYQRGVGYLNSSTGKFGNNSYHAVIPVNEGEKYILSQGSGATNYICYAFATSAESMADGDIPVVPGTSVIKFNDFGETVIITIPSGCTHLLFSWGDSWLAEFYDYFGRIEKETAVKRYIGRTGTGYNWLYEVDIPSGSVIRYIGAGALTLYDTRNDDSTNKVILSAGQTLVSTFDIKWLRGRTSTDMPFELVVYRDKSLIVDENGNLLKDITAKNINDIKNTIGGISIVSEIQTDYTFAKLPHTILKGSIIKSVTSVGNRTLVAGRTTNDTSEAALTLKAGVLVTKDINYIRWYADIYTIELEPVGNAGLRALGLLQEFEQETEDRFDNIYEEKSFDASFTAQYQQNASPFSMQKGMVVKSILLNGTESKLYGRTEDGYTETALLISAGTVLTKDINYLRNIYAASEENPATYTIILYTPYTYTDDKIAALGNVDKVRNAVHLVDGSSCTASAETISDGGELALENYPKSARKGDNISLTAKITSFSSIKIGKGCEASYLNSWFEIDDTHVNLYHYTSTPSGGNPILIGSEAHGLTIAEMININIVYNGSITIKMQSSDGVFEHEFTEANNPDAATALKNYYNSTNGIIKVISVGSVLTRVSLSATNSDYKCPIWIVGASYTAVYQNQMIGQLKKLGYFNYFLCGYPGCTSVHAFTNLQNALRYGTPQLLVWSIMSNDAQYDTWESYASQVVSLCESKDITLVFVNYPDMKQKEFSDRRQWVINSGHRYIDLHAAVEKTPYVYDTDFWYPGFMGSDGVHPTPLGANAMAMQILRDLPEIMQY